MEGVVLGDSIGQGLATTIGLKQLAQRSFSLRRGDVAGQLGRMSEGAVGLLSLGLNDAADPVAQLMKSVERVVVALEAGKRRVVWLGPPCVLKGWDGRAKELDAYLKERLARTAVEYVSLRDDRICAAPLRTRDGEHFTVEGYRYVWEKIRRDSPLAASIELGPCEKARAAALIQGRRQNASGCESEGEGERGSKAAAASSRRK